MVATGAVGGGPLGVAMSPSGRVDVSNKDDDTVSVIDASTNAVTTTIPVGNFPNAVAVSGCQPPTVAAVVAGDGRSIEVVGRNVPPSTTVTFSPGSVDLGTATTRPDGSFDATFVNIACTASSGTLTATGGGTSATTTVTLSSCAPVAPVFAG